MAWIDGVEKWSSSEHGNSDRVVISFQHCGWGEAEKWKISLPLQENVNNF